MRQVYRAVIYVKVGQSLPRLITYVVADDDADALRQAEAIYRKPSDDGLHAEARNAGRIHLYRLKTDVESAWMAVDEDEEFQRMTAWSMGR